MHVRDVGAHGAFHAGELRYIGQVGNSLPRQLAEQLEAFLVTLGQDRPAFVELDTTHIAHLDLPVVIEVTSIEVTAAGTMRQPVLTAVRPDSKRTPSNSAPSSRRVCDRE